MPAIPSVLEARPGYRTCRDGCGRTLPETAEFFYVAPGSGRMYYGCRECVPELRAEARRRGVGIARAREIRVARIQGRAIPEATATPVETAVAAARLGARTFGVEIEFTSTTIRRAALAIRQAGLACGGYTSQRGAWKVVSDGTPGVAGEAVSPVLRGAEGIRQVQIVCEALRNAGARVARCSGLHVHHGVSDLRLDDWKALYRNWANSERAIQGLVAPSRRTNHFCSPLDRRAVARMESLRSLDSHGIGSVSGTAYRSRFRSLNTRSYPNHGTVEVRLHQGTTDARKILAWVEFGQAMIEAARAGVALRETDTASLLSRLAEFGLSDETRSYLARRAVALQGRGVRV